MAEQKEEYHIAALVIDGKIANVVLLLDSQLPLANQLLPIEPKAQYVWLDPSVNAELFHPSVDFEYVMRCAEKEWERIADTHAVEEEDVE